MLPSGETTGARIGGGYCEGSGHPSPNDKEAPGPELHCIASSRAFLIVPQPASPQCIICRARSPLLRDLLLSCKLGLFTPNKAGDYLLEKQSIDGGGRWRQRRDVKGREGAGTVIKPFPAGLSFISSRGLVIFLLETIWGGRDRKESLGRQQRLLGIGQQQDWVTAPCITLLPLLCGSGWLALGLFALSGKFSAWSQTH